VSDLYYKGTCSATPVGYYKMDEGSGTSLTDSASAANTGSFSNAVYASDVAFKPRNAA